MPAARRMRSRDYTELGVPVPDPRRIDWDAFSGFLRGIADVITKPMEAIARLPRNAVIAVVVGAGLYTYAKTRPQRVVVVNRR